MSIFCLCRESINWWKFCDLVSLRLQIILVNEYGIIRTSIDVLMEALTSMNLNDMEISLTCNALIKGKECE
jgi:hypothetical protein